MNLHEKRKVLCMMQNGIVLSVDLDAFKRLYTIWVSICCCL